MSGILYPILILTLFLIVQILTMMASRKAVLDKNKQQLLDSVNASNKIYSNEELSILLSHQQEEIASLKQENQTLNDKVNQTKAEYDSKLSVMFPQGKREFHVRTRVKTRRLTIKVAGVRGPTLVNIRAFGSYNYVNWGGFLEYNLAAYLEGTNTIAHGVGTSLNKQGGFGNSVSSVEYSVSNDVLYININLVSNYMEGSYIDSFVTVYTLADSNISDKVIVTSYEE